MLPQIRLPVDPPLDLRYENLRIVDGTPSTPELMILCRLVCDRRPQALFEFGTFRGQTTRLLAHYAPPDAIVHTLDLPRGQLRGALPIGPADGKYVEPHRRVDFSHEPKIEQLFGDSARFSIWLDDEEQFDFLFVDGCHSYEYCLNDSLRALAMVRPGGVIVWHDYGTPHWPGVTAALDDLRRNSSAFACLRHVAGTSLVILETEK